MKLSPETRAKMSDTKRRMWASLTPEERQERKEKAYVAIRRSQQMRGLLRKTNPDFAPAWVDPDFDEGF